MTFRKAVQGTPDVAHAWRPGLQALCAADGKHVRAEDPQRLRGSVNIDKSLQRRYPNDSRWDYAVGYQPVNGKGPMIYWIEIHPATQHGVTEVLNKREWLLQWLKNSAPLLDKMRRAFVWVSSGKTSFIPNSPQAKKLAADGVQYAGRLFIIPNRAVL